MSEGARKSGRGVASSVRSLVYLGGTMIEVCLRLVQQFCGFISIGVAGWILGRGPRAFLGVSWEVPRWLAPYWVWGIVFLVIGVGLAVSSAMHSKKALWWAFIVAGFFMFFAMSLLGSVVFEGETGPNEPISAGTGVAAYGGLAAITLISGVGLAWEELDRVVTAIRSSVGRLGSRVSGRRTARTR